MMKITSYLITLFLQSFLILMANVLFIDISIAETNSAQVFIKKQPLFTNVIDRKGTPEKHKDYDHYQNQKYNPMSDLGAWHGFLLPDKKASFGAFTGPMIIAEEYSLFIADKLEQLSVSDSDTAKEYDLSKAEVNVYSQPGALIQRYVFDDLTIELTLRFVTNRTALITTSFINKTKRAKNLQLIWQGGVITTVE
ncbi:MAG: hypothetical protein HRT38_15970 [Alteromonadaceae bacterium]|nr:hypothetical protein [Alteromonadaceae bacterium]